MHDHSTHSHSPVASTKGRAFAIGIALNLAFVVVEAAYGFWSKSLSLLADAGHNFSDVLGLVLAWLAVWLSASKPTHTRTYGLKSSTILSALGNAVLLLVAVGGILWEAIQRFGQPAEINGTTVMIVAAIGIVVNGVTALLFMSGKGADINIRGAFWHMAADALVSLGVVVSGFFIQKTGLAWIDPIVSVLISAVIAFGTFGLLRESFNLAVQGVPSGVDPKKITEFLSLQNGVAAIHDLHIWGMSTTENALTVHLIMPKGFPGDEFLRNLSHELKEDFGIHHSTIQVEVRTCDDNCALPAVEASRASRTQSGV